MNNLAKNKLNPAQTSDSPSLRVLHPLAGTPEATSPGNNAGTTNTDTTDRDAMNVDIANMDTMIVNTMNADTASGGENLSAILLAWYDKERRILPWREDPTPYHVWLSEVMLQQTRVDTVIDYYNRFLKELPDVAALANADEDRLLKLWQGLGYYSRIRNMHKAAKQVMTDFGGEIPGTPEELQQLSGIGEYVAAAISSIAFQYPAPSVDGNLLRVFARMTAYEENIRSARTKKVAHQYYEEMLPQERPGDMNQALMDLGATICLPNGMPLCESCPWQHFCEAHRIGREKEIPIKEEKRMRKLEKKTMLRIVVDGKVLIRQRPAEGLLANLYELPNEPGWLTESEAKDFCRRLGYKPLRVRKLLANQRVFTHVEWHLQGYEIEAVPLTPGPRQGAGEPFLATEEELRDKYSLPTAFRAYYPDDIRLPRKGDRR